ncbi:MAG TPA: fused MFS/spermidine synthase [Thermomicrobiales bacterium]
MLIPLIYGLTAFASATLLFLVQPMFARMLLPMLGGAPAVWNTALVFYQAVLLAGYLYAHLTTRWLGGRQQWLLHAALVLLPLVVLPIAVPGGWQPPTTTNPIPWLLALLTVAVGLPFFVISTSSPLLQAWYARTGHRMANDPYILYAASNVGSMCALLGYPTLIEPRLALVEQSRLWSVGYVVLVVLILACAALVARSPAVAATPVPATTDVPKAASTTAEKLSTSRRLRWLLLAFIPSSLMMSVTTYITTQIAPLPLLWVIPLAIYLLTFILVFAGRPLFSQRLLVRAFPLVLILLVILMLAQATQPMVLIALLHLVTFFLATMICHGAIAADRPAPRHLTEFYLWMSAGGVLGGIFNALVAPVIFPSIVEYPLVLALTCLILPRFGADAALPFFQRRDLALPLILGGVLAALIVSMSALGMQNNVLGLAVIFGPPALCCFSFSRRPLRFALGLGVLFLVSGVLYTSGQGQELATERSFFGLHRIMLDPTGRYHTIVHGGTVHGMQSTDPARLTQPLTYYYPTGPAGQIFAAYSGAHAKQRVGVVGLGAGSLACYQRPGQSWTFYELDPRVEEIARDPRYFTYLRDCAPDSPVVLGDGRLSLAGAPDGGYDLLMLDAYSSDTVPVHLLTREALALYLTKLAPDGVLAFHISNQYLDLKPVIARLADDVGLVCLAQDDLALSAEEAAAGKSASQWVVMARRSTDLERLGSNGRWTPLVAQPGTALWTDSFSSILELIRWR